MQTIRVIAAVGAAVVSVGAMTACGGDSVPGDSVARVGDSTIKNADFNHWLRIAAISQAAQTDPQAAAKGKTPKAEIPKPPDFAACIADKKANAPKPVKGQPKPTDAQYKQQCQAEYNSLRDQVMQFLISAQWIQNEAADQDIKATDAEVQKQFQTTKKQSFPKETDFKKFLASSGMTMQDLLYRVRIDTLSNKLREKVTKGKDKVTDAEATAYYNKNKDKFAQPERRDLRIVLTKTQAKAQQAKSALQSGQSWKTVAKKFSIDQASKDQGGVLLAVSKGQQEPTLDKAVFAAKKGQLTGPVKTQFGYYVFAVQKVTKASQQSLAQAKPTIKQLLASQNQQKALDDFVKDFQKKWKDKTTCRSGFVTQDCKNAPKQKTTSTATPSGGQTVPVQPTTTGG
jgi:foldase protein PrsA